MTMAELTALVNALAPAVAGLAALGGVWLGVHLEGKREDRRGMERREEEQRTRIRDRDLRNLDETRQVLVGVLTWLERRVVLGQASAVWPDTDGLTRYNIALVGDAAAIQAYGQLVGELQEALPMTKAGALVDVARGWLPKSLAEIDVDLVQRTTRLRAQLLSALDAQEERVMRDQPLARLTMEELSSIAMADAVVDRMRERQRSHRSTPDPER